MNLSFFSKQWLRSKVASAHARIILNRFTAAFFVFSFLYCFIQGIIQSLLFTVDFEYSSLTSGIVAGGDIPLKNMTFLEGTNGNLILRMCNDIPHGQPIDPCFTIFDSKLDSPLYSGGSNSSQLAQVHKLQGWENGVDVNRTTDSSGADIVRITPANNPQSIDLDEQCIQILLYPSQILKNLIREDIAWICLQFWLLAISFIAILNDSVPHILAVLMTRMISTGWAIYAIWRGPLFRENFQQLLADPGTPCSLDIFSQYWGKRQGFEIADLILSCTGLIFFLYLSWSLLKLYSEQSFKCVGAPEHIMRIHKFFMGLLACLQLEAFVLVTTMGIWIDVLFNTAISKISTHTTIYEALYVTTAVLLIPWITVGWYSIRRELRVVMIVYLGIGFALLVGWSMMFYSQVFRWSFLQWPYLGCFTVASLILLISSLVLGIVCRLNFGKGLAEYLHAESALAASNFEPDSFARRADSIRFSKSSKDLENFNDPRDYLTTMSTRYIKAGDSSDVEEKGESQNVPVQERSFFEEF